MIEIIDIDSLYIPYPESLYSKESIESNPYLLNMRKNVENLPPIEVINLGNEYSLSDGYHRVSIFKYLNCRKISAEVH